MNFSLTGKVALVTGAARGMGLSFARALCEAGAKVVLSDISSKEGEAAASALVDAGHEARFMTLDVGSEPAWQDVLAETVKHFGRLDVLVNNAGISGASTILDTSLEAWNRTLTINLTGVFLGCKHAIPLMAENGGGSIINISSIFGQVSDWMVCDYSASKGGVRALTKSAALLCGEVKNGVRVNSVHPGFVETPMVQEGVGKIPEEIAVPYMESTVGQVPLGRIGQPDELAGAIVFLASDAASYMTGSEITVDGGFTAR